MCRPIRQQLLLRIALALAAVALCVSVAGVLAARQEASQRLDDSAAAAKSVFQQTLLLRTRSARGRAERAKAFALATADASRATGTHVTVGSPASGGRLHTYPLAGGRRLSVVVSASPVSSATRSALFMGLGIGAGVVLVLVSLLIAGIDRAVAKPLARLPTR